MPTDGAARPVIYFFERWAAEIAGTFPVVPSYGTLCNGVKTRIRAIAGNLDTGWGEIWIQTAARNPDTGWGVVSGYKLRRKIRTRAASGFSFALEVTTASICSSKLPLVENRQLISGFSRFYGV